MLVQKKDSRISKKVLEKDIQREILEWLDKRGGVMFWRQNNGAVFGRNNGGNMAFRALPKFSRRGIPDIWVIMHGRCVALEVKHPKTGILRPEQKAFGEELIRNGACYYVVTSVDDVKVALSKADHMYPLK